MVKNWIANYTPGLQPAQNKGRRPNTQPSVCVVVARPTGFFDDLGTFIKNQNTQRLPQWQSLCVRMFHID
jgi:hypothetical protein